MSFDMQYITVHKYGFILMRWILYYNCVIQVMFFQRSKELLN